MAVRRPNKKAPAGTTTRKQTVAGRKRGAEAGSSSTPDVEVADQPRDVDVVEAKETSGVATSDAAQTAAVETAAVEQAAAEKDDVKEATDDVDDFVAVDDEAESSGERVLLVKLDDPQSADAAADADTAADKSAAGAAADSTEADKADAEAKPTGKARRPVSRVSTIKAGTAAAAPSDVDSADETSKLGTAKSTAGQWAKRVTPTSSSSFVTSRTAVRLGVAAVVIGLIALILAFTPGANIGSNKAFVDHAATDELTSQARSKVCLPVAVTSQDFDKWSNQARGVLVGTALKNFNDYLPTQKKLIEQSKLVADCRVDSLGVRELSGSGDGAQAKVLASILVSQNLGEQLLNSASVRVDYTLEKHGDQWLISGVDPF